MLVNWWTNTIVVTVAVPPLRPYLIGRPDVGPNPEDGGPLRRLSDFTYLAYLQACTVGAEWFTDAQEELQECLASLKWVVIHAITSTATKTLIDEMLEEGERPGSWPGIKYAIESEEGRVLLGSPLGHSVAMLLGQHLRAWDKKYPPNVHLFEDDPPLYINEELQYNLAFEIQDVPDDPGPLAPDPDIGPW